MSDSSLCVCGSGKVFNDCCEKYLRGELAPDAEAVMRSRYTAFCKGDTDYLRKTWHPETCPPDLGDEPANWISLEIIDKQLGEQESSIEFEAKLFEGNKLEILREISFFEKIEGKWLYCEGEFPTGEPQSIKIRKGEKCPCGSGKLFKNCHGKK